MPEPDGELAGKVVIVTGATGNLGSACARRVAAAGAAVVVSDLPGTPVEELVADLAESGGRAVAHEGDVSSEEDVSSMVAASTDEYGRLDGLVNVAAAINLVGDDRDLTEMEASFWDLVMAVNARGPMLACKHAIPVMLRGGGGSIVNFSSPAATHGDERLFAYSASKAAVRGLTVSVATAYGRDGIRCNAVAPGCVWSEAYRARMPADLLDVMERTALTPRLGLPEDIADTVAFLLSDRSAYITAQTISVDGGIGSHQPWVRMR